MRRSSIRRHFIAGWLALLPVLGIAAGPLPPERIQGAVTYVTGGIGLDESEAMKQAASGYPLELLFVLKTEEGRGAYLAGNRVVIRDEAGKTLLDTTAEGPFLFARLPAGRYTVTAWRGEVAKSHAVQVAPDRH